MKQKDIKVGKTYRNAGAGRTARTVIAIGPETDENRPHNWGFNGKPPEGALVVTYMQCKNERHLYLKSFAAWAGSEVVF